MSSLFDEITAARETLVREGFAPVDASIDAEVLARHLLGWDRAALLTRGREPAPQGFVRRFTELIERRRHREPVAQITGHREFWGLDFEITRDVLVPRPDTELIVEAALLHASPHLPCRIADVGTGSGCLAVALAVALPAARIFASDLSPAALAVARRNARRHHVLDRIALVRASLLDAFRGPFDLIVSNPPYVPSEAKLPRDVGHYEPALALFGGSDGLDPLRALIRSAADLLITHGRLIVEFGYDQADDVRHLASIGGWREVAIKPDIQGIARVAILEK